MPHALCESCGRIRGDHDTDCRYCGHHRDFIIVRREGEIQHVPLQGRDRPPEQRRALDGAPTGAGLHGDIGNMSNTIYFGSRSRSRGAELEEVLQDRISPEHLPPARPNRVCPTTISGFREAIANGYVRLRADGEGHNYFHVHNTRMNLGFLVGMATVSIHNVDRDQLTPGPWTQTSPEAADAIRDALMDRLGGRDFHVTRLLPAIITMSEIERREIPGGHTVYALHDENGVPTLAILRASVMLEHDVFPLFTVWYDSRVLDDERQTPVYEIPPFDLPDPDDDQEDSSWRRVGDNRLAEQIVQALEQQLVQQEADYIASMATVDEADAWFDDEEVEFQAECVNCRHWEAPASGRPAGRCYHHHIDTPETNHCRYFEEPRPDRVMHLGQFANEEYAESYHRSERGRRHNVPAPAPGSTYYDTTLDVLRMFVGDRWVDVGNNELADILAPEAGPEIRHNINGNSTREVAPAPALLRAPPRVAPRRSQLERAVDQKKNPIKPCEDVILSTDKPTRLVEAVEEPDDIDS